MVVLFSLVILADVTHKSLDIGLSQRLRRLAVCLYELLTEAD